MWHVNASGFGPLSLQWALSRLFGSSTPSPAPAGAWCRIHRGLSSSLCNRPVDGFYGHRTNTVCDQRPSATGQLITVSVHVTELFVLRTSSYRDLCIAQTGGTAAAAPPPFRPGNPALCGSCPLVTPYYSRLRDFLCYTCMLYLSTILCVYMHMCNFCFLSVFWVVFLYSFLLQYFDTVGWVFWPVKTTVFHITYTVLAGT